LTEERAKAFKAVHNWLFPQGSGHMQFTAKSDKNSPLRKPQAFYRQTR